VLGYNHRQAYYKAIKREQLERKQEEIVLELTKKVRHIMPRTGTSKLYPDIKDDIKKAGLKIGRDKVHNIL